MVAGVRWQGTAMASVRPASASSGTGVLRLRLADFAPLGSAFGSVRLSFTSLNAPGPMPPFLVTRDGSRYRCVSAECTHAGCILPVFVASQGKTATCSCHGSRFALDGSVVRGPATVPLTVYPVELVEEGVLAIELFDLPSFDLNVEQVVSGTGGRVAVGFEALRNVDYEVLAGPGAGAPLQVRSFATSPTGETTHTVFKGTGAAATVYLDTADGAGVVVVSAKVKAI